MNYYYDRLSIEEQAAYDALLKAMRKLKNEVQVPHALSTDSMGKVLDALRFEHTGLFYVNYDKVRYLYSLNGTKFQLEFDGSPEELKQKRLWLRETLAQFKEEKEAENLNDDRAILRWIHHKLVRSTRYDHAALDSPDDHPRAFNILGVFQDHLAVCQGIAFAFKLLCDYFEIPCMIATGRATLENIGDNLLHAWNIVCLDGKNAHVDITWDIGLSELSHFYRYDYFCIPDEWIKEDHAFEDLPACVDNISYFEAKKRVFHDYDSLRSFVHQELKKKTPYLYFKMSMDGDLNEITASTDQAISETVGMHSFMPVKISRVSGGMQMCFFYRMEAQELPASGFMKWLDGKLRG